MLSLLKKLFGTKSATESAADAPYKVEAPKVEDFPVKAKEIKPAVKAKTVKGKKPAAKAKKPAAKS